MAIANNDGTITLSVQVDQKTLEKSLASVKTKGKKSLNTLSHFGGMLAKGFTIAATAATTAIVGITKQSVTAYAEYEQLVGGVETLFKGAADKVKAYAEDAFYTAGVSANEYMQQVTSFSASLISSCAGDTEKAADIANMALIDISDNVNKMGSSQESVTLAYQGFAKQQYMLLDNLKLGYGGTKTEMQRLLKDAQAITGVKYDIDNLADVYNALHVIQEQLDITGTTAKEAEKTISGSANMMKASWQNVLAAISGGGDLDKAINNLVFSMTRTFENIAPTVQRAIVGIGQLIENVAPMLVQTVTTAFIKALPNLLVAIRQMLYGVVKGIINGIVALFKSESGSIDKQLNSTADGVQSITDNVNDLTKAEKDLNKELKNNQASFDKLNIISDTATNTENENISTINSQGAGSTIPMQPTTDNNAVNDIKGMLAEIMGFIGGALVAIGIFLVWFQIYPLGITLIVAGAAALVGSIVTLSKLDTADIKDVLNTIIAIASGALLALGIIMTIIAGPTPLSIGLIAAGAIGLCTIFVLDGAATSDAIANFFKKNKALIIGVSIVLLILGIILCVTGVGLALGIALIAAGAAGLITTVVINFDFIKEKVQDIIGAIFAWIKTYGMLVLGVILCTTGAGIPFGLAIIISWFKNNYGKVNFATVIVDKIKEVFAKIKAFLTGTVATFLVKFINGLIGGFETFLNFITSGIRTVVNGLASIAEDIGGLLGFDFTIPKLEKIKLPRLAQGAVIPANREFLAVLGDQKQGVNIETPLSTMIEAFETAMSNKKYATSSDVYANFTVELDGDILYKGIKKAETKYAAAFSNPQLLR